MPPVIPEQMRAMVLAGPGEPLTLRTVAVPQPEAHEFLIRVSACGVCRTDLHIVDGELTEPALPLIPGHQVVGHVIAVGQSADRDWLGRRVGVPWLGGSCGVCDYCRSGRENLCDKVVFHGLPARRRALRNSQSRIRVIVFRYRTALKIRRPRRCYARVSSVIAPIAWPGIFNAWGLYGFGAAAHILIQVAKSQQISVSAFTRPGDEAAQKFALSLGAEWAGDSSQSPPGALDAAIIFAPDGRLVPAALKAIRKGGRVVCAGIHMSDIPGFPYQDLWGERCICSVANLTRRDGEEFLPLAADIPVKTEVRSYSLEQVNEALDDLRHGRFTGAAVVIP